MSIIGKIHEISLYGLITTIVGMCTGKVSLGILWEAAIHPNSFRMCFYCYLFWASVLFVPIAIIGAFATKYGDGGKGLTFHSDNLAVIIFAHIAEELLGLILTPFWFLKDLFTDDLDDGWKIFDYITYAIELVLIAVCVIILWINK